MITRRSFFGALLAPYAAHLASPLLQRIATRFSPLELVRRLLRRGIEEHDRLIEKNLFSQQWRNNVAYYTGRDHWNWSEYAATFPDGSPNKLAVVLPADPPSPGERSA